jgi:ubiquinone/menaquinone biosynthesis C-methylase UbiE
MNEVSVMQGRFVSPQVVVSHFHLRPGDRVADFGAGKGAFSVVLASQVGPKGRVYACEIQKNLVEAIADTARSAGLNNIEPIWCDIEKEGGTKIESETLDAAVLVNTLFQMENKVIALKEIHRTLRIGGKLLVIDWSESFGGLGPQSADVVDEDEAKSLCESNGYSFERKFDAGDHHYGLSFRKV